MMAMASIGVVYVDVRRGARLEGVREQIIAVNISDLERYTLSDCNDARLRSRHTSLRQKD